MTSRVNPLELTKASDQFRFEADMVPMLAAAWQAFATGLNDSDKVATFFEVRTTAGIPDLIWVLFDEDAVGERERNALAPITDLTHLRVLRALAEGRDDVDDLAYWATVSRAHLRRTVLPALVEAGWIEHLAPGERTVQPLHTHRSAISWVVTVEAKLSKWRDAATQARRHTLVADRAFIALDGAHATPALAAAADLAQQNIGLVTLNPSGDVKVVRRPKPRSNIPDPLGHAFLGESVLGLRLTGASTGPERLVFGRDLRTVNC